MSAAPQLAAVDAQPRIKPLRDYQSHAIGKLRAAYASGSKAVILVSPTGSGKSRCGAEIARLAVARGGRVLILAPRLEILGQLVIELEALGIAVRRIHATTDEGPADAPVVVASVWTLSRPRWRDQLPAATLIIVDEAHRALADESYGALLDCYPTARALGLSATPARGDGRGLRERFDTIVVATDVRTLTDAGYLVPCRVLVPATSGDALALPVVESYQQHAAGRLAIVFAASRPHARKLLEEFTAAEIPAGLVTGETPDEERAETMRRFTAGELRVLINISCFVEGLDVPGCAVAILARKFGSPGPYLQALGRILRPAPGKTEALAIDLVGSALKHGPPDMAREYSLDGKAISTVKRDAIRQCRQCGSVYASAGACPHCGFAAPVAPTAMPRSDGRGVVDLAKVGQSTEYRLITARRSAPCRACKREIVIGSRVWWSYGRRAVHRECAP